MAASHTVLDHRRAREIATPTKLNITIMTTPEKAEIEVTNESSQALDVQTESKWDGWKSTTTLCLPIALVVLLVRLDETILATAIPQISDEFNAFDQISWYGPSYLFGLCIVQLPIGRAYKELPTRALFLSCLMLFEIASIIQAAAPTSIAFIVGRVLAGIGGAGAVTGGLVLISEEIPKSKIAYVMSMFSWLRAVSAIGGPILGGAIATSSLTWRWCFYINPIMSIVAVVPMLILWRGSMLGTTFQDFRSKLVDILRKFDYSGMTSFMIATISLLLALQFGGSMYDWSDGRTVATLVVAAVFYMLYAIIEWRAGTSAMVPYTILSYRIVLIGAIWTAAFDAAYFVIAYELPLWFQAVQNLSAIASGYHVIAMLGAAVVSSTINSILAGKLQYYQPLMLFGSLLLTSSAAILTTLHENDGVTKWLLGEILAGLGFGSTSLPLLATRDQLDMDEVPIGYGIILTAGYLGSSIGLAIAQAIVVSLLKSGIASNIPSLNAETVRQTGATDLKESVPSDEISKFLALYNHAITRGWYTSVALASLASLLVFGLKWKKMQLKK